MNRRIIKKKALESDVVIDYKDPSSLEPFITSRGKIIPRRLTGANAKQQRFIAKSIKRARFLGLLPYCDNHKHEQGFLGETTFYSQSSVYYNK